ncbi:MAG: MBL fold metallo-hydrolase [Sulfuricurvum sp.]|jgi:glyoxylase-like metal-dependent hydrolase (beta-lactamase superfamily II)
MESGKIILFEAGYCLHPEVMVVQGGSFRRVKFPAMAALISHPKGNLLWDTGYGTHFFTATSSFPEKLYALTTPVTLDKTLREQLSDPVDWIFISHFHADHIGGLRDFPEVPLYCSRKAYNVARDTKSSRFTKTRMGILPSLLPDDFEQRVIFIETLPKVDLPPFLSPFTQGYLLLDRYYLIELKGHAVGHYGLVVENTFFISDAVWDIRTITQNRYPNPLTRLIMENGNAYDATVKALQQLHKNNPDIALIPTHCSRTLQSYCEGNSHG